jgi:phenylalanine-4-hydroxylase
MIHPSYINIGPMAKFVHWCMKLNYGQIIYAQMHKLFGHAPKLSQPYP